MGGGTLGAGPRRRRRGGRRRGVRRHGYSPDAGADPVLGLDLDLPTLRHVGRPTRASPRSGPTWSPSPSATASVDVVVSAQTVEHLWDQERFVAECARVLRPGGRLR